MLAVKSTLHKRLRTLINELKKKKKIKNIHEYTILLAFAVTVWWNGRPALKVCLLVIGDRISGIRMVRFNSTQLYSIRFKSGG